MKLSDKQWQGKLAPAQYDVLRNKGTEMPFTGKHLNEKRPGIFVCAGCGAELFDSKTKFESDSGWPSFYDAAKQGAVKLANDKSHGMQRTEAICANCGGHLGHVFNDAPKQPTGQRYCINSLSLNFNPAKGSKNG